MSIAQLRTIQSILFGSSVMVLAAGCGDGSPKVYPVQGKVVFKGQPGNLRWLSGGKVRCQSIADANVAPVGAIEDDGSFTLGTIFNGKGLPGVPAGQYKARVEPRRDDDDDDKRRPPIHAKYLDYDKSGLTFTVPASGEILIEVERGSQ